MRFSVSEWLSEERHSASWGISQALSLQNTSQPHNHLFHRWEPLRCIHVHHWRQGWCWKWCDWCMGNVLSHQIFHRFWVYEIPPSLTTTYFTGGSLQNAFMCITDVKNGVESDAGDVCALFWVIRYFTGSEPTKYPLTSQPPISQAGASRMHLCAPSTSRMVLKVMQVMIMSALRSEGFWVKCARWLIWVKNEHHIELACFRCSWSCCLWCLEELLSSAH